MGDWKYYHHATIPTTPPHIEPDLNPLKSGKIWEKRGVAPLLARWTTDFDCGYETDWWYCIKDNPFDIMKLNSKRRYEVKKGIKNFVVKEIQPLEYIDEIYDVTCAAFASWPLKYRPVTDEQKFKESIKTWGSNRIVAAFTIEENVFAGYAFLSDYADYTEFNMLRVNPEYEKKGINVALVNGILEIYKGKLIGGFYILDGARSIYHQTNFQDYLEKYFEFRKAYCILHMEYNPKVKWIMNMLYPFRKLLVKFDDNRMVHTINSVLKMDEISRKSK